MAKHKPTKQRQPGRKRPDRRLRTSRQYPTSHQIEQMERHAKSITIRIALALFLVDLFKSYPLTFIAKSNEENHKDNN